VTIASGDGPVAGARGAGRPRDAGASGPGGARAPRRGRWLAALFVLAFVLRLLGNVAFEPLDSGPSHGGFYDGVEFDSAAMNLVERGSYVIEPGGLRSFRAPGFPFLIAAVYWIFGPADHVAAHVVFCLVGALLVLATWKLAREVAGGTAALVAAALVAVDPNLAYWCLHFSSEPLYTLLLTASLWLVLRGLRRGKRSDAALAGLLLGCAVLTRPLAVYFAPALALALLWAARDRPRFALASALLFCAGAALPVVPWTLRNAVVHGRFVLVATNGGSTFWGATNQRVLDEPSLRGGWITTNAMPVQKAAVVALPDEVERDQAEWECGRRFLADNPAALPRLLAYKFLAFWTPLSRTPRALFNWAVGLSYGLLLPFMMAGLLILSRSARRATALPADARRDAPLDARRAAPLDARRDAPLDARTARTGVGLIVLTVLLTLAGSLLFYGSARFRSVIEPLLLILAAAALVPAWRWLTRRRGRRT
jgi:4-amino-4-deoxy-L-arabinose transferase-like glycosyltransferase